MPSFAAIAPAIIAGDVEAVLHFFKHDLNGNAKPVDPNGSGIRAQDMRDQMNQADVSNN
ncbi:hypothetical protein M2282_001555 [Variovorax boronicumulans]|uniref:hypothetical protein n=1 Tax=Variovorax boronicumulans TaxID=436515 RepID=UPI0024736687|nr:hypothetical protein [Variovorax boronicumulans]MDH6166414.1 hypothetical protein [Variovorax boronicumulans]